MTEQGRLLGIRERSVGLQLPPSKNHGGGVNFMSSSTHGNTACNWSASQQSPPRTEIRVVTKECLT